jgi:hypothetical protein
MTTVGRLCYQRPNNRLHRRRKPVSPAAQIAIWTRSVLIFSEYRPYGGAILHMLLSGIAGNFSSEKPEDVAMLDRFSVHERELEDAGEVQSDFAVIVANPKC